MRLLGFPPVLDACCGPRGMWYDKRDGRAIFADCREENFGKIANGQTLIISPDIKADFTSLPFPADTFYHVVFDPPHCNGTQARLKGCTGMKYGLLFAGWEEMLRAGFAECFRVLKPNGTLIFKWNEQEIPVNDILKLTPEKPLYGHRSGKAAKTHWIAFLKPNRYSAKPRFGLSREARLLLSLPCR